MKLAKSYVDETSENGQTSFDVTRGPVPTKTRADARAPPVPQCSEWHTSGTSVKHLKSVWSKNERKTFGVDPRVQESKLKRHVRYPEYTMCECVALVTR